MKNTAKMKTFMAAWRGHKYLTVSGANLLCNTNIMGRFRYYVQAMKIPEKYIAAIEADCQALAWSRDKEFDQEELGTNETLRRYTGKGAQHGNRKLDLGAGLMNWRDHVKALQAKWILNYRDASSGHWKVVLDRWLAREVEGRGAAFSTMRVSDLTCTAGKCARCLPDFWIAAVHSIRELELVPLNEDHTTPDDAKSHPIWFSPLFRWAPNDLDKHWRERLQLRKMADTFKPNGETYDLPEIEEYIESEYAVEGGVVRLSRHKEVTMKRFLSHWQKIIKKIPRWLHRCARSESHVRNTYSTEALRMMGNMGWTEGRPLGTSGEGITTPIDHVGVHSAHREGIGLLKRANDRGPKPDPIKAMMVNDVLLFGRVKKCFEVVELDIKGRPRPTPRELAIDPSELRQVVRWRGGVAGAADSFFPNPARWRLKGIDKPLDRIEVNDLTKALSLSKFKQPTCKEKWEALLGPLDWREVGARYASGLQTPKDFGPHFKLVLHRTMRTRDDNWQRTRCRLCKCHPQTIEHWGGCEKLRPIFEDLRALEGGGPWLDYHMNLMATGWTDCVAIPLGGDNVWVPSRKVAPRGISMVHFIMWKFIMIAITANSMDGLPVSALSIIDNARRRVKDRLTKLKVRLSKKVAQALSRCQPVNLAAERKWIEGLGSIDDEGNFEANEALDLWLN